MPRSLSNTAPKGAAVVAHSGGPTPVINASLLGIVEEAHMHPEITALYGARFGIAGILSEDFIDLYRQPEATLKAVARTPSSALGTSRREVGAAELAQALSLQRRYSSRRMTFGPGMPGPQEWSPAVGARHASLSQVNARHEYLRRHRCLVT